jgi:Cellulase (glycosyl hydrolase family 5)
MIKPKMTLKAKTLLSLLLACTALAALGASQALASHSEAVYFEDPTQLLNPHTRPQALLQMQHLGVKALRLELSWNDVAPAHNSPREPNFDATNPASYAWEEYDAVVAEAQRLHWQILLTVTSPVPEWATSTHRDHISSPNAKDFEQFMTAVGRHYGSKVSLFAIWNEPNHPAFLQPQFNSHGQPASPRIYRALFQAGYNGLKAAGLANPKVLMGETAPTGSDTVTRREGPLHDVAPLAFLRGVLCLNGHYHKAGNCGSLPAYGYAHHAYTIPAGPFYVPPGADNVMIGSLSRLSHALDLAARAHAIRAGMPIYLTEFGVQSKPNQFLGVSAAKQAEFDAIAEHIAWSNPRVVAFSQYLLRDDPLGGAPGSSVHGGVVRFQTGLEYVNGQPKPLYFGWPIPLVVSHRGHGFSLWGLVRPTLGPTTVAVLVQPRGSHKWRVLKNVHTDALGDWSFSSGVQGTAWKVRWTSPGAGGVYEGPPIHV